VKIFKMLGSHMYYQSIPTAKTVFLVGPGLVLETQTEKILGQKAEHGPKEAEIVLWPAGPL
jgi:hypothetical protein